MQPTFHNPAKGRMGECRRRAPHGMSDQGNPTKLITKWPGTFEQFGCGEGWQRLAPPAQHPPQPQPAALTEPDQDAL